MNMGEKVSPRMYHLTMLSPILDYLRKSFLFIDSLSLAIYSYSGSLGGYVSKGRKIRQS